MLQVTFAEIARVLEVLSSTIPAAESHGCLCGALCMTAHYPLDRWLDEIIPDLEDLSDLDRQPLGLLFADTVEALRGDQMTFEPLLPDDQATLEQRASALSQWCQGFLYGFGSCRPARSEKLPENVAEVLRDLTHIGQATVDADESGEEQEEAYTEVVEYVRAGVQLIHDELIEARVGESSTLIDPDAAGDSRPN